MLLVGLGSLDTTRWLTEHAGRSVPVQETGIEDLHELQEREPRACEVIMLPDVAALV